MSKSHPGLPIPDDWNGTDWCHFSICWPDSLQWRAILAGFITTPMLGRTWDGATGTIADVQQIGRQIFENNLDWRYCLVSTCSESFADFIAAIRYLADKTGQSGCCNAPGTPGGTGTNGTGTTGQEIHEPITEGTPPEGFDTWEEFETRKCGYLSQWLDRVEGDISNLSIAQLAITTVSALLPVLAVLLLSPIPGDELFALAAILVAVAAYGWTTLSDMATAFTNAKSDILCILYNGENPASDIDSAIARFNTSMEEQSTDLVKRAYASTIIGYFINADGLNRAYVQDGITYPGGDCSGCVECTDLYTTWELESSEGPAGEHWTAVQSVNLIGIPNDQCTFEVDSFTLGGTYDPCPFCNGLWVDQNGSTHNLWCSGVTPTMTEIEGQELRSLGFRSDVAFTMSITLKQPGT